MIKWTLVVLFMGSINPVVMPNPYPDGSLCTGAGEALFEFSNVTKDIEDAAEKQKKDTSKFWCLPYPVWGSTLEELKQHAPLPKSDG